MSHSRGVPEHSGKFPNRMSISSFSIHTTPSPSASSHGLLGRWLYSEMCPVATNKDSASSIAPQWAGLKACCWVVGWRGVPDESPLSVSQGVPDWEAQ